VRNLFKGLFAKPKATATASEPDRLWSAIEAVFPAGPIRRGSFRGVARALDLTDRAPVIDEILVFDGGGHWFFLFLGCRALGLPFELGLRIAKRASDGAPPDWPIDPVTRVANAIGDGAECAPGVTWRIGPTAVPGFAGFVTLRDPQFGAAEPDALYQLVPVTADELELRGEAQLALIERLYADPARMIGVRDKG
jgi:hypothetical protein